MEVAGKEEDKEQKDKISEGGSTSKKPVIFNGPDTSINQFWNLLNQNINLASQAAPYHNVSQKCFFYTNDFAFIHHMLCLYSL